MRQDSRNGKPDGEALLFKSSRSPSSTKKPWTRCAKRASAELLQDVGYHKATHGGQPVTQMRLYTMTLGMFYLSSKGGPAIAAKLNQALPRAFEKTVDVCGKQPDAKYLEQLGEALKATP